MTVFDKAVFATRDLASTAGPIYATGAQTGGAVGIFEGAIPPGSGVHWHMHTRETECFHVIEGRFRFWCGNDVFEGGPGATLVAPTRKRHRWQNIGDTTGRLLMWVTPGGFERFFIELDALPDKTPEAIFALETTYGIVSEILAPEA